jgi:hypothetical protein
MSDVSECVCKHASTEAHLHYYSSITAKAKILNQDKIASTHICVDRGGQKKASRSILSHVSNIHVGGFRNAGRSTTTAH